MLKGLERVTLIFFLKLCFFDSVLCELLEMTPLSLRFDLGKDNVLREIG